MRHYYYVNTVKNGRPGCEREASLSLQTIIKGVKLRSLGSAHTPSSTLPLLFTMSVKPMWRPFSSLFECMWVRESLKNMNIIIVFTRFINFGQPTFHNCPPLSFETHTHAGVCLCVCVRSVEQSSSYDSNNNCTRIASHS